MKRILSAVLCCLVLCLSMSFALADEPVTLRFSWWGGDSRAAATLEAINVYMEKNPNVKIEAEYSAIAGYYQKLVTQLASGNAPDFFQVDQGWVAEMFARGDAFADMNTFSDLIDPSTIAESMLNDYCIKDGKLVVLPLGYNGTVFLYNKALLGELINNEDGSFRWTWEDMYKMAADLHSNDPEAYMTVAITDSYVRYILKPMLEQITNQIPVQDDLTPGFTVEQMAQAFEEFKKIFDNSTAQPYSESVVYDSLQNNPLWINGKIGGVFLFFSNIDGEIANLNYELGVCAMPKMEGALTTGQECCPSLMIAINKNTDEVKQKEAAKFINWMINDPEAAMILGTQRGVPASSVALSTLRENNVLSPLMSQAIQISEETVGFKNGDYEMDSSIHAIFVEKMEKVIYGVASPMEAAQELYDDLTARLNEIKQQ